MRLRFTFRVAPLALAALLLLASGCSKDGEQEPEDAEPLAPGRHVWTTVDGQDLPYVVSGSGETTVVLVHCWMCNRDFWNAQLPALNPNYRVLALDLPGHGEGGVTRRSWTIDGFGEDVAGLLEYLDLQEVILVGHSMGGPVSLRTAGKSEGRVKGIVAVDSLQDADLVVDNPLRVQWVQMFERDFRSSCTLMVQQMFVEEGVEDIQGAVHHVMCTEANEAVGQALFADFLNVDFPTWFAEAGVPIRAINASGPNPTEIEHNRKYADYRAILMDEVGHFPHMTRPEAFNEHLLAALDELDG